jgi:predicted Zn-dependent peptidase
LQRCQQPPWGELVAVNVNTGDIAWSVPLGSRLEGYGETGMAHLMEHILFLRTKADKDIK